MQFDYNFTLLLLIFMRISGCILFNPILGRKNIPPIFNVGLCLLLTFFSYPLVPQQTLAINSPLVFCVFAVRELLLGLIIGYIIQLFLSVLIMSGEMMDIQIGFSMSRIYDPQSNIAMPLSASLINAMFFLIFFTVNGHLTLIKIFTKLCAMVPYGTWTIHAATYAELAKLLSLMLVYAVKIALPVLAVGMVTEMAVGLIMRAIPQIDVFSINIHFKLIVGMLVILLMVPALGIFLDNLITLMFDCINSFFSTMI